MRRIRIAVLAVALIALGAAGCTAPGDGGGSVGGGRLTVILVHGFTADALPNWAVMAPGLEAAGIHTVVYRYPSLVIGAEAAAAALAQTVNANLGNGGKVGLLGHSEGGLVTKTCIVLGGCAGKVSHWFNISGVNNGTLISAGLPGNALGDMGTTSILVNRLKANNSKFKSQGIKCTVAWTATDGLVYPPTASQEPGLGCRSVNVVGTTHFTIIMDPRTVQAAVQLFRS
jgi:triacylglycerol esterase/lipase EstA (alpha/beta hydrolase family)